MTSNRRHLPGLVPKLHMSSQGEVDWLPLRVYARRALAYRCPDLLALMQLSGQGWPYSRFLPSFVHVEIWCHAPTQYSPAVSFFHKGFRTSPYINLHSLSTHLRYLPLLVVAS